jgi:quaternary ammonium compound-resistance protein SugE
MLAWLYLLLAGLLEVVWAFSMKSSEGFTKLTPTVITVIAMIASFALLAISLKTLPLSVAYTIWTGIGAIGAFLVGIIVLGEASSPMKWIAAMLIVSGLILMKISSK